MIFGFRVQIPFDNLFDWLPMFAYLISLTIQLFVPCYSASELTIRSEKLAYSIFKGNWMGQSQAFKRSMTIFVQASMKPILPLAGGIFVIGVPRFVGVRKIIIIN